MRAKVEASMERGVVVGLAVVRGVKGMRRGRGRCWTVARIVLRVLRGGSGVGRWVCRGFWVWGFVGFGRSTSMCPSSS